jgi:hypothetical protein
MATCPRCGNETELLAGELYILVRCEVCDDVIDAYELGPADLVVAAGDGDTAAGRTRASTGM